MEGAFEFFDKKGLVTQEKIDSLIMRKWSNRQVLDFNERFYEALPATTPVENNIDKFRFVANANLSAQLQGNCIEWHCRLRSIDKLSRFAVLYSDGVYIQDYYMPDLAEQFKEDELETRLRYAGNLKVLLYLRPLLESGIVVLIDHPSQHMCPDCMAKEFPYLNKQINSARNKFSSLATDYLGETTAYLDVEFLMQYGLPSIHFHGSPEIFHEGESVSVLSKIPTWMKPKIKSALAQKYKPGKIAFTKNEILKTGEIQDKLNTALNDILMQKMYSQGMQLNTKYLTDRDVDFQILNSMAENAVDDADSNINMSLANNLLYEMPIIQDVPITYLLKIRENDYDAFTIFKNSMSKLVNKYVAQHKTFTKREAKQLYLDEIKPQVDKLDRKVSTIRSVAAKKLATDIAVSTSAVAIGLFIDIIPPVIKNVLTAWGIFQGKDIPDSVHKISAAEDEIRNENLYFLWKIKKKRK